MLNSAKSRPKLCDLNYSHSLPRGTTVNGISLIDMHLHRPSLFTLTKYSLDFLFNLIHPDSFTNNASKNTLRIKRLSHGLESRNMLSHINQHFAITPTGGKLTSGSRFLAERSKTSLVFFVQCGRDGNSSISTSASLWSAFRQLANLPLIQSTYKTAHCIAIHRRC